MIFEKIKQHFDENNLAHSIKESVFPTVRANKKSIDKKVLKIFKGRASEMVSGCIKSFEIDGHNNSQSTHTMLSV